MKATIITVHLALALLIAGVAGFSAPAAAKSRYVYGYGPYASNPYAGPPGWFQYSVGFGPYAYGSPRYGRAGYGYFGYAAGPSASGYGPYFAISGWWDLMDRAGLSGKSP